MLDMVYPSWNDGLLGTLIGPVFGPDGLVIDTGLTGREIYLDFDEEIVQVKAEYIHGDILGVLQIAGSMAFTKSSEQ